MPVLEEEEDAQAHNPPNTSKNMAARAGEPVLPEYDMKRLYHGHDAADSATPQDFLAASCIVV
jgi:hypothetical protein